MLELICRTRPSLIEPLVFRLAMRLGLLTAGVSGWPISVHYRILRLSRPALAETPEAPLSAIELLEIPGERTLVTLGAIGQPSPDLERFAQMLLYELTRLDFLARPDTPKEPIGFYLGKGDELTGKRLLETFEAINSLEITAGLPPPPRQRAEPSADPATS